MSTCDTCRAPGSCCRSFELRQGRDEITAWDDETIEQVTERAASHGLPFKPHVKHETVLDEATGRSYSSWLWSCPLLGPDGRCADYENRPQLCRDYEPASDQLCAEYVRKFKGIPIRVVA